MDPGGEGLPSEWALWQMLDSLLPTGAFAHSLGLEAALRTGILFHTLPHTQSLAPHTAPPTPSPSPGGSSTSEAVFNHTLLVLSNITTQMLPFLFAAHTLVHHCLLPPSAPPQLLPDLSRPLPSPNCLPPAPLGSTGADFAAGVCSREGGSYGSSSRSKGSTEEEKAAGDRGTRECEGVLRSIVSAYGPGLGSPGSALSFSTPHSLQDTLNAWAALDAVLHAMLSNHVARRASLAQGSSLLRVSLAMFPPPSSPPLPPPPSPPLQLFRPSHPAFPPPNPQAAGVPSGPAGLSLPKPSNAFGEGAPPPPASAGGTPPPPFSPSAFLQALQSRLRHDRQRVQKHRSKESGGKGAEARSSGERQGRSGKGEQQMGFEGAACEAAIAHGHHTTLLGAVFALLRIPRPTTLRAFLFSAMRDVLSAATRLNLIGPLESAALQTRLAPFAELLLQRASASASFVHSSPSPQGPSFHSSSTGAFPDSTLSASSLPAHDAPPQPVPSARVLSDPMPQPQLFSIHLAHTVCPLLDLAQASHDTLPMRLFLS